MNIHFGRLLPLIIFLGLAVFLWRGLSLEPQTLPSAEIGRSLPAFELPVLGKQKSIASTASWQGPFLLNVWASWCSSCAEEQLFLLQLAKDIPIYGLNYKDQSDSARQWLKEWGNPYKLILQDTSGRVAMDLGVYGTPETFLIDEKGIIRLRHAGVMNQQIWQHTFLPVIKSWQLPS